VTGRYGMKTLLAGVLMLTAWATVRTAGAAGWTHLAADPARSGQSAGGPANLRIRRWLTGEQQQFVWQSTLAAADGKVIALGVVLDDQIMTAGFAAAYDLATGQQLWIQDTLEPPYDDSFAGPAIDPASGSVFVATGGDFFAGTGGTVYRLDLNTGQIVDEYPLAKPAVNVSPAVGAGRVYVTDTTYGGPGGKLYAFNIATGQEDWSVDIGGTSGNSASYCDGKVYVANTDGRIACYDAETGQSVWQQEFSGSPIAGGFYGGLSVVNGYVYAASYVFAFGAKASLVKLDAADGAVIWTADCERTDAIPLVADGKIFLTGGIDGYGSSVRLECFQDGATEAVKLWETPLAGGWTHQPAYSTGRLYVGKIPTGGYSFGPSTDLYVFDATKSPADGDFVINHVTDCGSSAALTDGLLLTLGIDGLYCFAEHTLAADLDLDGVVNWTDFTRFASRWLWTGPPGQEAADLNGDGAVDWADFALFATEWLRQERWYDGG